ncbi:MAG: hypothetical protein ACE5HP_08845 [Gemmatimonadota bacterium]
MILPNVRSSFGRPEAEWLVHLLGAGDPARRREWESCVAERGLDPILDDPATLEAILAYPRLHPVPATLVLYVMLRRALLESGIESRSLADYVTALVLRFGDRRRSLRIGDYDDNEYHYLVDVLDELREARGRRAFLLRAHLGNYSLWLAGLFPDYIVARVHRRGGPGLDYYEELGQSGFSMAAEDPHARREELDRLYGYAAEAFVPVRRALNRFSDRLLFPAPRSPVDRLLRQVRSSYAERHLDA